MRSLELSIAARVARRFLARMTRQWPELGLYAQSRKLRNGDVVVTFEGNTLAHRGLLERLGAKWHPWLGDGRIQGTSGLQDRSAKLRQIDI